MNHKLSFQKLIKTPENAWLWTAFWIALFFALTSALQLCVPYPIDDDTAYHFSVGRLIGKYGILHSFPWTTFSWQFDHYADKEFIFHLLFVPLSGLEYVTAARIVGVFCGALALSVLYLVLRAEKVKYAGAWAVLPLTCSTFLFRFALVRPHLLSIALAVTILWALGRGRLRILALGGVLYPLSYVAFWQIPLLLLTAVQIARFAAGERISWKPGVVLLTGIIAGVMLHPNTENLIKINWIHMSDILFQGAWGRKALDLAKEFNPYTLEEWARYMIIIVFMATAAFVTAWKNRQKSFLPLAFAIAAVFFGLLTAKSLRFIEYFVPFSVAALGLSAASLRIRFLIPALLGLSLLYMLAAGTDPLRNLSSLTAKKAYVEPGIARYFQERIPPGSQVFTCGWDHTGNLMLLLPERRFLVAADPTLFYKENPELYKIWTTMTVSSPLDSAEAIRLLFKSRFVICLNYKVYWDFFETLEQDPSVKTLFANEKWVLFDLQGAPSAQ